jgi:hypothetical protein
VFHRFLAGERGSARVKIALNGRELRPFDPFHSSHPATIRGASETIQVGAAAVEIQPFTLPHHRNVLTSDWERYAGPEGYLKNQGFYLYRERRLIVHGSWFGLARQMELTKLARVRIDIPNGLDAAWHIDIKKASARPPGVVRERLRRIIEALGAPSRRVYTRRGTPLHDSRLPIWRRVQSDGAIIYGLNPANPVLQAFEESLPEGIRADYWRLLQAIGAALPMDAVFADLAGSPEDVKSESLSDDLLRSLLETTLVGMRSYGIKEDSIPEMLRTTEPFRSEWERVDAMLESMPITDKP